MKYCNASCKKKHRHKHKKQCEEHIRQVAELHDEKLFKDPPSQYGDCPICFERLPTLETGRRYKTCCGKTICSGCSYAPVYDNQGNKVDNEKCPFCRTPLPYTEANERRKKRVEPNDPAAMYNLGVCYRDGLFGFQDYTKALEHCHRAGELGYAKAYASIGYAYDNGEGVEIDKKRAKHYYELAAIEGNEIARHNLGSYEEREERAGNMDRALKHLMIAVSMIAIRVGDPESLEAIKHMYLNRHAAKDDYTKELQSYQEYLVEIKSVQRDEAEPPSNAVRFGPMAYEDIEVLKLSG